MADAPIFYSEEETYQLALAFLQAQPLLRDKAIHPRSYLGQQARALAQLVGALAQAQRQAYFDAVPAFQVDFDGIIRSRASSQALDNWAFIFGLPSNRGAGIYGRNGATPATGGQISAAGIVGTFYPAGSQLVDTSGKVVVATTAAATIPGIIPGAPGFVPINVNALTVGSIGNLTPGQELRWQSPPLGSQPTAILGTGLTGGADEESDFDLLARLLRRLQFPPKGGTANDYRTWAQEATDSTGKSLGIVRAHIFVGRNGRGSIDIVPTVATTGAGSARDPGAIIAAALLAYIEARRPVNDIVRIVRPSFPAGQSIKIRLRIKPGAKQYAPDWDDGGTGFGLVSTAGTSLVITGATPPAALKNAVTNAIANGTAKPRVQVGISGFPVPQMRRVLGWTDNAPIAGQSTLTLDQGFSAPAFSHTTGYAGSSAVDLIAQAALDSINGYYLKDASGKLAGYIEGVGPSTQSGYADPLDAWQDVVSIAALANAALSVRDAAGVRVAINSRDVGQVGAGPGTGVTIAVGAGAFSALDFVLFDNVPGQGPQLPDPILVLVTS
jgi:hypothetical protein